MAGVLLNGINYSSGNGEDLKEIKDAISDLYKNIGLLTEPVTAMVANHLPMLKRNITDAFYNGSLRAEIAAGNFKNVRPGDYIIGQATGSTYFVAECDYRLGRGDQTNNTNYPAYGTHHLGLMLYRPVGTTPLWKGKKSTSDSTLVTSIGECPWAAASTVDPTSTSAVGIDDTTGGYQGSFILKRIDAILLPQCFQADFGAANVLKYREYHSNAINKTPVSPGNTVWTGVASAASWMDRYLDLPSEPELYGGVVAGSSFYDVGTQNKQLSIFRNADIHNTFPRLTMWTKAVVSSSLAAGRYSGGNGYGVVASAAICACPLACVK